MKGAITFGNPCRNVCSRDRFTRDDQMKRTTN